MGICAAHRALEESLPLGGCLSEQPGSPGVFERSEPQENTRWIEQNQDPRAPGHGGGHLERRIEAPYPELMRQVEPEREHADREKAERDERNRSQCARARLLSPDELERGRESEDARDDPAEEQVDHDLPAPGVERRVDLRIGPRRDAFDEWNHGLDLKSGRRRWARRRSRDG